MKGLENFARPAALGGNGGLEFLAVQRGLEKVSKPLPDFEIKRFLRNRIPFLETFPISPALALPARQIPPAVQGTERCSARLPA